MSVLKWRVENPGCLPTLPKIYKRPIPELVFGKLTDL